MFEEIDKFGEDVLIGENPTYSQQATQPYYSVNLAKLIQRLERGEQKGNTNSGPGSKKPATNSKKETEPKKTSLVQKNPDPGNPPIFLFIPKRVHIVKMILRAMAEHTK